MWINLFYLLMPLLVFSHDSKYYRYSYLKKEYYESYYNLNIFNSSCNIAQFIPISDQKLLFQFNWMNSKNKSAILKGVLDLDYDYNSMTCFNVLPIIDTISELCLQEVGIHTAEYIIFTNKKKDFYYGMVENKIHNEILLERMKFYNNTHLYKNSDNCVYPFSPNN